MGATPLESIADLMGVLPTLAMGSAALLLIALLLARPLADVLIRQRVRRLPAPLAERFSEEWAAEARALENPLRKVAFALALFFTPTHSFVEAVGGPGAVAGNLVARPSGRHRRRHQRPGRRHGGRRRSRTEERTSEMNTSRRAASRPLLGRHLATALGRAPAHR